MYTRIALKIESQTFLLNSLSVHQERNGLGQDIQPVACCSPTSLTHQSIGLCNISVGYYEFR